MLGDRYAALTMPVGLPAEPKTVAASQREPQNMSPTEAKTDVARGQDPIGNPLRNVTPPTSAP